MSTHTNNVVLRTSAALTGSTGTTYGSAVRVDRYDELNIFFRVTAQGTFVDETLTVSVQTKDQAGNYYDLAGATFTAIGDKTAAVPYSEDIAIVVFGSTIRLKYVVTATGATVNYTFGVTAIGKGSF